MIEFIIERGWIYSGNCVSCGGGAFYTNSSYPGYRLKISGNTQGIIQQNQNPVNRLDFKNVNLFTHQNYESIYNQYFK